MSELRVNQTDPVFFLRLLGRTMAKLATDKPSLGLLIIHLEDFDRLISAFGYQVGNRLIAELAGALRANIRPQDKVVRIGESKFAVVISPLRNQGILILAANKLTKICAKPFNVSDNEISVKFRIGMATGPEQGSDAETLLQNAETALLAAVSDDESYTIFARDQQERASDSLKLDNELEKAIKNREFELYYQPKISTRSFMPCGAEALIRWNNPKRGFVSPEVFIPLADRTGRMEPLTMFVLNTALKHASQWPRELSVSINLSPKTLQYDELVEMLEGSLKLWDFEPSRLIIEITEGALMDNPEESFQVLNSIRRLGVKISIDDFGTGYSSLAYFKNIPADELKIDKSFVLNMFDDEGDKKIVRAIVQLSKQFGLEITAEGVEDERTSRILAEFECDRLQGYHYSRPLPSNDFLEWIQQFRRQHSETA